MKKLLVFFLLLVAIINSSEERSRVDEVGGASATKRKRQLNDEGSDNCLRSLLNKGIYYSDPRFNAFVDGVMVNMLQEMKRKRLDPLYFRVNNNGSVEHVPTHGRRIIHSINQRSERQLQAALGGGIVTGLSTIRRFGDASVQIAGNITLIKSHWLVGPLTLIIDYRGNPYITRVQTEVDAVQIDTLTSIDRFGAQKEELRLNSPFFGYMAYYGNRTLVQQKLSELVVKYLYSQRSFLTQYLMEAFEVASYDKIIPQFGAGENYYSVLQYLYGGRKNLLRNSRARDTEESNHTSLNDTERDEEIGDEVEKFEKILT